MSSSSQEFIVRVPRELSDKKFNVMRFGSALNVEPNKWKSCQMFRENESKDVKTENDLEVKEFGAGSEFGRKQRDEMRRKKYQKRSSGVQQPWVLKTGGKHSKKYKGLREGGVSENASYYVFFQAPDGAFEAYPVQEWYNFTPIQRYKALTAEEAEEKFEKRDKILNYFSVMINKNKKTEDMAENSGESKTKVKKELKVSDMDEWHGLDSDNDRSDLEDRSEDESKKKSNKITKKAAKAKKAVKKKKKNGSDDEDDDSEPQEESDEGDFDDKEVDYMSDSSDDSEESETEKIDKEMKGVEDEDALRQLVLSEDEDEEENKEEEEDKDKEVDKTPNGEKSSTEVDKKSKFKDKLIANFDSPPPSSSDSDSDDPDAVDDKKSALLAPVKLESDKSSRGSSRSATPTINSDASSSSNVIISDLNNKMKRKISSNDSPNVKKPKLSNDNSDGITEEAVRRYLMRKPMTCTDLLQKFKNKVSQKGDLVHTIAQILKRLNPEKQTIKTKLYFSLKPT